MNFYHFLCHYNISAAKKIKNKNKKFFVWGSRAHRNLKRGGHTRMPFIPSVAVFGFIQCRKLDCFLLGINSTPKTKGGTIRLCMRTIRPVCLCTDTTSGFLPKFWRFWGTKIVKIGKFRRKI